MPPQRRIRPWLSWGGLVLVTLALLNLPVTTRQGLNAQISVRQMPLYVKAVDFLHRHFHYQLLAKRIVQGLPSESARARAILTWTHEHIRPTPAGWPVIDDHILDITIRGHGQPDQMADVFTTLSTYAKLPAFWRSVKLPGDVGWLVPSFVQIDGRWRMFDVEHGLAFADAQGQLYDVRELLDNPRLVQAVVGSLAPRGIAYQRYVDQLVPFYTPKLFRAQQQMPGPRLMFEVRRALGLGPMAEATASNPP